MTERGTSLSLINRVSLLDRPAAVQGAKRTLDDEDRSGTIRGEGKEIRADRASEPVHLGSTAHP